jgi:hypothetical protein
MRRLALQEYRKEVRETISRDAEDDGRYDRRIRGGNPYRSGQERPSRRLPSPEARDDRSRLGMSYGRAAMGQARHHHPHRAAMEPAHHHHHRCVDTQLVEMTSGRMRAKTVSCGEW